MATNIPTLKAIDRICELIDEIQEHSRELKAWKKILVGHKTAQKAQGGLYSGDAYVYNKKTGIVTRHKKPKNRPEYI